MAPTWHHGHQLPGIIGHFSSRLIPYQQVARTVWAHGKADTMRGDRAVKRRKGDRVEMIVLLVLTVGAIVWAVQNYYSPEVVARRQCIAEANEQWRRYISWRMASCRGVADCDEAAQTDYRDVKMQNSFTDACLERRGFPQARARVH